MADISKVQLPDGTSYDIKDKTSGYITGMTILSYGSSTWQDFIDAYNANRVVYCRASSNSDPSSGAQTRLAFMAYVNSATPTQVEFQYYRSVSSHTDSQQGDQVFVYTLNKTSGWSVITRNAFTKIAVGGDLTKSYSSGTLTISGTFPTVPTNVSDFTNDAGYLTSSTGVTTFNGNSGAITFSETDPTVPSWAKENSKPSYTASEVGAVATTAVGAANGVAPLNSSSKIDATYLPSYVDDVIEGYYYNNKFYKEGSHTTEIPGETGKIYVDLTTEKTYRWSGTAYIEISPSNVGTVTSVGLANATDGGLSISGTPITSSGSITVGHSNILTSAQTTEAVYPIKIDKNGHISSYGTAVTIPTASTTAPSMDGTASYGSGTSYARSNHVHPTDTSRQATLVSGTNIKTINNESILGSGNISISSGTATDVQINGTSIVSSNVANIITNTAYNSSTNKVATMADINASITSTDDNAGNVVLEGVDASSSTPITGISMNGTILGTSGVINIPAATASSDGVVSTGTQKIAGTKIFQNNIYIDSEAQTSSTTKYTRVSFRNSDYTTTLTDGTVVGKDVASVYNVSSASDNAMLFVVASPNAAGTDYTTKTESYHLPHCTPGLTSSVRYDILTTKDYEDYVVTKSTQQNISGLKWFSAGAVLAGNYEIKDTYNYSEFDFRDQTFTTSIETASGTRSAYIINSRDAVGSSLGNKMHFVIRSPKADGTGYASGHDIYKLPAPANGQTTNPEYDILTTKNTKTTTVSLTTANWTSSNTQTVTVTGMTANAIIMVSAAPASEATYRHSGVYCSAQAANSLTFTCTSIPTAAITVNILTIG